LTIDFNAFDISYPLKVKINREDGVLINAALMDFINLKYLKFNVLYGRANLLFASRLVLLNSLEQKNIENLHLKSENQNLNLLVKNTKAQKDNSESIYENKLLYYKEKAKGKFKAFLLGTSIGAVVATLLILLLP
jgi:hypothetical protein